MGERECQAWTALYVGEDFNVARGFNSTASDRENWEDFAGAIRSPNLIADRAQIGVAFDAFLSTWSKSKRHPHRRNRHVFNLKYPAFAFGSVIIGAVLIGPSSDAHAKDVPAKSQGSTPTLVLPAAQSRSDTVAVLAPSSSGGEPDFISPTVVERARQRIRDRAAVGFLRSRSAQESPKGGGAVDNRQQAMALAAKLPLPNLVIARTIERIGYACGAVVSATALDGDEQGVYKVTCTSGRSYQARPVHGRYHFRRL